MRISILTSDSSHPVYPLLVDWRNRNLSLHEVQLALDTNSLSGGDLLFLISCHHVVGKDDRAKYRASLVLHASDLPQGRGWSPLAWQLIEGKTEIVLSLLEAGDTVDSGAIWKKEILRFEGHELYDEINEILFRAELRLMDYAVRSIGSINATPQDDTAVTYYRRRRPEDSRIDPHKSIAQRFDVLRIADPDRFPAFMDVRGHRYILTIRKAPGRSHE